MNGLGFVNSLPLLVQLNFLSTAALWQEQAGVFRQVWGYINRTFTFGRIEISLATLIQGLVLLAIAFILSRSVSAIFERRLASRPQIDPGIAYTIARLTKYLLISIGILIFLKVAFNLDLTSLAVVFTALSVGIGFGLQYLAADIASGFILLFERPIRVGDRITIGQDEGDVRSINLRTTTVYTNDRVAIIVPNSRLVTERVVNWSYGDPRTRIAIPVSVATDSDVDLVTRTLLNAAEEVEMVLTEPPPKVQFLAFGEYSWDFRLLIWTRNSNRVPQIRSDINYRIARLFRERGVTIPFPIQELRVKTDDDLTRAMIRPEGQRSEPKDGE